MGSKIMKRTVLLAGLLCLSVSAFARADDCNPCAGVVVADLEAAATALAAGPALEEGATIFVARTTGLGDRTADTIPGMTELAALGATPWIAVEFVTRPPLLQNAPGLGIELETLARFAGASPPGTRFQILWPGGSSGGSEATPEDYSFLVKRAAVAVTGAQPEARVVSRPIAADPQAVQALFANELAAYLDGVALSPASEAELVAAAAEIISADPGVEIVVDALPMPEVPERLLVEAARLAHQSIDTVLFKTETVSTEAALALKLMAREFSGDVSPDYSAPPAGAVTASSFVRGEDLSLRIVVETPPGAEELRLRFSDGALREPAVIDLATGESVSQYGTDRTRDSFSVRIADPAPVVVLSLQRMTAAELEGILGLEEEVTVAETRQMPVEEILRRHQAFEDAQARKIDTYTATNTSHLRFQFGTTSQSLEATFKGPYFFSQGGGYDWVWQEFFINGVRWKRKTIPEIPLVQPEKAAALPVEITFNKEYRYSLRGTEIVGGRDAWIVDFAPAVAVTPDRTLYQGSVWIDRELYARVKTRAVQLGLEGEVVSNEETLTFSPLSVDGSEAAWSAESYFLPTRLVGQQIWSLMGGTTVVEREILLENVRINPAEFAAERQAALDSEATIVRDTDQGLKYLVVDEDTGERVVKDGFDTKRRFLVGGVFYDENQDFPLPLGGMNWFWFDWRGKGIQANAFIAGAVNTLAITDPDFLGSKWSLGVDGFLLAVRGGDTLFRDGVEQLGEEIKTSNPNFDVKLGRQVGNFGKFEVQYQLGYRSFKRADDTAPEFILPSDHLNHEFRVTTRYNRKGYRLRVRGEYNVRGEWDFWGLPGNTEFETDDDTYTTWNVGIGKTWHLPKFLKFGAEVEYLDGSNLDRFSKYDFGTFSSVRVRGYESGKVRAEEALATHLSYGWNFGGAMRLELLADAAWATEEVSGLDRELLGGVGVAGTVVGPWSTLVNVDLGFAVTGPDDGLTATVAFLKLFNK